MDCDYKQGKIPLNFIPLTWGVDELNEESKSLRRELRAVYKAYKEKMKVQEDISQGKYKILWEEYDSYMNKRDLEMITLKQDIEESFSISADLCSEIDDMKESREEWIGRTLKFQYLFEQMKKIGLQQSKDIFECFEDIEIPEVSIHVKDKFIPTAQTDNIDWVDDEEFNELSDDDTISEISFSEIWNSSSEIWRSQNQAAETIQRYIRRYLDLVRREAELRAELENI